MGSLKRFRVERAEAARLAREHADQKKKAPAPADVPVKEGPYERMLRKLDEDRAAARGSAPNEDQPEGEAAREI